MSRCCVVFVLLRRANSAHGWHASGKPALAQPLRVFVRVIEVCRFSLLSIAYKIRMFIMNRKRMRRASSLSALPTSSAGHGADAGAAGAPGVWKVNPSAASSLAACAASPGPPHAASVAAARPATASVGGAAAPPLPGAVHGGPSPVSHASAATITAPPASTPTAPPAARSIGGYGGGATAGAPGKKREGG